MSKSEIPLTSDIRNLTSGAERLAKRIARAGLCSRREAEKWIAEGRVKVGGKIITTPAFNVSEKDAIVVDGKLLQGKEPARLWLYHKPAGLMTTHKDPQGRPTVFEKLPKELGRVISIGRLDLNSEGLLLLTNDGALARQLELPSTGWIRRYRVRVYGAIAPSMLTEMKKGVTIGDIRYGSVEVALNSQKGNNSWLTMALTEGKNREIRNIFEHFGCKVSRLLRLSYGPFQLGNLGKGEVKEVSGKVLRSFIGG
jgi:23S rRNA pseudouridine2605 synthase